MPGASVPTVAARGLPFFLGSIASQASVRLSPTIVPAVEASIKVGASNMVRNQQKETGGLRMRARSHLVGN